LALGGLQPGNWESYERSLGEDWSGVVMVDNSQYSRIYGNFFDHWDMIPIKHRHLYVKAIRVMPEAQSLLMSAGMNSTTPMLAIRMDGVIFISKEEHGYCEIYSLY